MLDGEIVCLMGRQAQVHNPLFRRGEHHFYAFDLLWGEGEDLRPLPLMERKKRFRSLLPQKRERLLYCDYIEGSWVKTEYAGRDGAAQEHDEQKSRRAHGK